MFIGDFMKEREKDKAKKKLTVEWVHPLLRLDINRIYVHVIKGLHVKQVKLHKSQNLCGAFPQGRLL